MRLATLTTARGSSGVPRLQTSRAVTSGTRVSTVTDQVDGTWTRSGSTVTLNADGEAVSATLSDGTLRMMGEAEDLGTVEWVFRK